MRFETSSNFRGVRPPPPPGTTLRRAYEFTEIKRWLAVTITLFHYLSSCKLVVTTLRSYPPSTLVADTLDSVINIRSLNKNTILPLHIAFTLKKIAAPCSNH